MQRIESARFLAISEYLNLGDKPHTILKHETRNYFRPSETDGLFFRRPAVFCKGFMLGL